MAARRVELERSLENRPSLPKTLDELCGIGVRRHTGRQTLAAFEYACRPGEAVPGHVCGEQSIGRRFGSVELLRVGGVPADPKAWSMVSLCAPSRWATAAAAASVPAVPVVWKT